MATKKKLLQAAAGQAGGEALNVEDVFSTHLYTGTDAAQTITNGIDLAGEGGLVWMKNRTSATVNDHALFDSETVTGSTFPVVQKAWVSNDAGVLGGYAPGFTFTSTGFTTAGRTNTDESGIDYVTWSFRKCPKFFDVVNYTGNSTSGRTISHNLGAVPAMIMVFGQGTGDYWVYNKDVGNTKYLELNKTTAAQTNSEAWDNTTPTDSVFTVGDEVSVNYNNFQYTAYLFAHNDGDGEFGPDGDADIIKCGSYTGTGSSGLDVDLGFEPQWLLIKNSDAASTWYILDNMRGIVTGVGDSFLHANATNADTVASNDLIDLTPTGFKVINTGSGWNSSGNDYIYIAIRRGPMAVPESATDVFAIDTFGSTGDGKEPAFRSTFPVDMQIYKSTTGTSPVNTARLTQGKYLSTDTTDAENTGSWAQFDYQNGFYGGNTTTISHYYSWMWRRAPKFFDVVAYTGTGSNQTISHNLGVAPKFMIVKERTTANNWVCYLEALGNDKRMALNAASAVATDTTAWQSTTPTDNAFYVGANTQTNVSGEKFIAYLFGEVAGISKFGTYTGTGSAQNIDCGFSSGARFVLVKTYAGTNPNANWNIWDSERGIVAGNDPYLALNSTSAEVTSADVIDPYSSGFSLTSSGVANNSGTSYWFYAIA
jgi:hypothetical protein